MVLLHYQGNTSRDSKDLPEDLARALCDDVLAGGMVPVVLDWDGRTSLANGQRVFCPDVKEPLWSNMGTGDAEVLAALIERAALMVGVDSGPLHVAAATTTPSLAVWLRHHPLHFFHPADNVTHLVPEDHLAHLRGDRAAGADFFTRHYRHQAYHDLAAELRAAVQTRIKPAQSRLSLRERALFRGAKDDDVPDGLVLLDGFWVRDDNAAQDLVIVHDVFADDCYLADAIPHPEPVVVDVGAHIGCFSKRLHDRLPRSRVVAVECCPENILALSKNIGPFATVVQAALTYEPEPALLNAVYPGCCSTGGSILLGRAELRRRQAAGEVAANPGPDMPSEYWADLRTLRTLTLEQLMQEHGLDHIDVLKLDCEGSEFSILRATQSLDRIGLIVGEYHDRERFEELVRERFAGWELRSPARRRPGDILAGEPGDCPGAGSHGGTGWRQRLRQRKCGDQVQPVGCRWRGVTPGRGLHPALGGSGRGAGEAGALPPRQADYAALEPGTVVPVSAGRPRRQCEHGVKSRLLLPSSGTPGTPGEGSGVRTCLLPSLLGREGLG